MPSWKKVITSGSSAALSSLTVSGAVTASSITASFVGPLQGTSSWSSNATTASYALNGGSGATFPYTGSAIISGSLLVTGSMIVSQSLDTNNRMLYFSDGVTSVDWGGAALQDNNGPVSVLWGERSLIDSVGNQSVDWTVRTLSDPNGNVALNWSDIAQVVVGNRLVVSGSIAGTNGISLTAGNITLPGYVSASSGFTGSFSGSFFGNGAGLTGITATADTTAVEAQIWFLT